MILTVDIGNTTISLCGLERTAGGGYAVCFSVKMDTDRKKSAEDYRADLARRLESAGADPGRFEGAVLSSVVPALAEPLRRCVRALTGREAVLITAESDTGLIMDVPEPERVGLDRVADAAWAAARYPLPAVTVDMGTATTFNVVDVGGVFRGGAIAPGLETGLHALSVRAAQLPDIELRTPDRFIGRDTRECMLTGAVTGAAAMIDGITAGVERELGRPVTLVITGGLARHVVPLFRHTYIYDPDLLPKGLALLYDRNAKREGPDLSPAEGQKGDAP